MSHLNGPISEHDRQRGLYRPRALLVRVEDFNRFASHKFVVMGLVSVSPQAAVAARVPIAFAFINDSHGLMHELRQLLAYQSDIAGTAGD